MRYCVCLTIKQLLGRDCCLVPRSLGPSIGIAALSWFDSHLELCGVLSIVWRLTKVIVGVNVRSHLMGRGRLSVISAYRYARHERTSAPHKRMLRSSLSGASNMPSITDRRRIDLRDRR